MAPLHFVSDLVDLNVWHAIHSRKTPEEISLDSLAVEVDREALAGGNTAGLDVSYLKPLIASCVLRHHGSNPQSPLRTQSGEGSWKLLPGSFLWESRM